MNGNEKGKARPTPENTLLRTNDRANAAFRCSAVVWSAMIAFHDDRKAPSPTPAARAARTIHRTSVVTANTRMDGGKIALPISKRPFRPRRSEEIPRGAALTTIATPTAPRRRPTTCDQTPVSGKYAVMKTMRQPNPTAPNAFEKTIHRTLRGIAEKPRRVRRADGRGSGVSTVIPFPEWFGPS